MYKEIKQSVGSLEGTVVDKRVISSGSSRPHQEICSTRWYVSEPENEVRIRPDVEKLKTTFLKPSSSVRTKSVEEEIKIRQPQFINSEVAHDSSERNQPYLMRVKRLQQQENNMESCSREEDHDDNVFTTCSTRANISDEKEESFIHIIVGGVVQKIPISKSLNHPSTALPVRMRPKFSTSKSKPDRRISCKDLGQGDCEGWLYKRKQKERTLARQWEKRWCVLKNYNFYCYRDKSDLRAEGVIHLPAFQVSPVTSSKKKFIFKIHNTGTTFCFASERQDDMGKWMNKMGLAAIIYDGSYDSASNAGTKPNAAFSSSHSGTEYGYSESEDEESDKIGMLMSGSVQSLTSFSSLESLTSPQLSPVAPAFRYQARDNEVDFGASTKSLHSMLRCLEEQDLTIDGKDKEKQRRSRCTVTQELIEVTNKDELEKFRRLHSLQRTLQAKLQEMEEIDSFLNKPMSRLELYEFVSSHDIQLKTRETYM